MLRLVPLHPDELRRGEARKDDVAGDLSEARIGVELRRFLRRAPVVPEDAGAERAARLVEQRRAVHVAGEADALDALQLLRMIAADRVDHARRRGDPAFRVLLRPARVRALDLERLAARRDDALIGVDQHHLHRRGADVDSEIHGTLRLPRARTARASLNRPVQFGMYCLRVEPLPARDADCQPQQQIVAGAAHHRGCYARFSGQWCMIQWRAMSMRRGSQTRSLPFT